MNYSKLINKMLLLIFSISFLTNAVAIELKPTHYVDDKFSIDLAGNELIWHDKTGILKVNEVIKYLQDFKEKKSNPIIADDVDSKSQNLISWGLSIIKNNTNTDFSLRVRSISNSTFFGKSEETPSIVYIVDNNNEIKSIDTENSGKFNNFAILRWRNDHHDRSSRYSSILIPKDESVIILRRIGIASNANVNYLRLSGHEVELEADRLSLYLQGIAAGAFLVFILLALFSAICKIEKSNKYFFFWLLTALLYILLEGLDGDRLSEFFLNKNPNSDLIEHLLYIVGYSLFELSHIFFIILLSSLIDFEKNFPELASKYRILIVSSIFLGVANYLFELPVLGIYKLIPEIIGQVCRSIYFIIAYLLLGLALLWATVSLFVRKHPQAIYLLAAQIIFVLSSFNRDILNLIFEDEINFNDVFLTSELAIFIKTTLFLLQALVLNFSIIRKMKFLQIEVILIGERNRQILAEQNKILEEMVEERTHELYLESQKSERLMLNILPESIASRLKAGDDSISDSYQNATILFSDLVGFTKMSSSKTAQELVFLLNDLFRRFDKRATALGLEKIKTIGDAYMVAGGLPTHDDTHAIQVTKMALGMYEDLDAFNQEHGMELSMRIGINSGPVVAGVIGHTKFSYDIWGNTVNTASRMESTCTPGKVQVSPSTYHQIKDHFQMQENQLIECKGLGKIMTYFVK